MKRDTRALLKEIKSLETELTARYKTLDTALGEAYKSNAITQDAYYDASIIRSHIRKSLALTPQVINALQDAKPV